MWRYRVDWPLHGGCVDGVLKDSKQVLKRDPAHILFSASENAAYAKFKGRKHLLERASSGIEHSADS